jgi:phosphoglucomutase
MAVAIRFGTSGWRGVIADEFTFANVRRAVTGVACYVSGRKPNGARVVVGRDPRFLGEMFVDVAAKILAEHGITPLVIADPAPTPAIAYYVRLQQTDGAINFTASHNPPEFSGIKFSTPDGAPALPEVTHAIEAEIDKDSGQWPAASGQEKPEPAATQKIDIREGYLKRLRELVQFDVIRKAGLKVAFDPMWGAARGYSDELLRAEGIACDTVHDQRDVLFGNHAPEPDDDLLDDLRTKMRETGAQIGIATDGDADRFGIVDGGGEFIAPNYVIALLFDYLVETRGWKNGVAKSVTTTNMINALAEHHGVKLYETPVGFKFIGELIDHDAIAIGGEESAGLSIRGHVPEKDGVLAGLLCCEMVARRRAPLSAQLRRLFDTVGTFYPLRQNFRLTPEVRQKFTSKISTEPGEFFGRAVKQAVRTDGLKLVFGDGSWVCYRISGTEPVVRIYCEARTPADLERLSEDARRWVFEA